jgi:hypothetical protein
MSPYQSWQKRSTEGTSRMRTPFVHISEEYIDASYNGKYAQKYDATVLKIMQHFLKSMADINWAEDRESTLRLRNEMLPLHISYVGWLQYFIYLSWYVNKYMLCSFLLCLPAYNTHCSVCKSQAHSKSIGLTVLLLLLASHRELLAS